MTATTAVAEGVKAIDAYVPQSPPGAMAHAAYMRLENTTNRLRSVIGVEASGYGMAHLHSSETKNGVAMMSMVHQLDIAPGQSVSLEPGGLHIMLMGPAVPAKVGDTVDLQFLFADGETLTVATQVKTRQSGS
ncbi:copper chaperone PCu(A)C [uncultured Tateyamaria sp.]|uniref:copper chaperone PCu(A)C n=1 Tax=uncultured Tateyamaria sp. TaxID=455651 RepID=UPI00262C1A16|nr:copper chaperone PCu(A)C [uncultured Tateyamaria sp.]